MKVTSASRQTAPRGGQSSLGLFGVPGFECPQQPLTRHPRATRIKGALNSFDRDGLSEAHYRRPVSLVPALCSNPNDEPEVAYSHWLADLAAAGGCTFDEESAAYSRSFAGVGYIEHLMALEG